MQFAVHNRPGYSRRFVCQCDTRDIRMLARHQTVDPLTEFVLPA